MDGDTVYTSDVLVNQAWLLGHLYPLLLHAQLVPCVSSGGGACDTQYVLVRPVPSRRPNAIDPMGTHIEFMNLPAGWTSLNIDTLAGDLVREIRPADAQVNGRPQPIGPRPLRG